MKKVTPFTLIEAFDRIIDKIPKEDKFECFVVDNLLQEELKADFNNQNDCLYAYVCDIYIDIADCMKEKLGYEWVQEENAQYYVKIKEKKEN